MEERYSVTRWPLPEGVRLEEDVFLTMRDGVKLAVDIYRPEKAGRYPVLLSLSPYQKEAQAAPPLRGFHSESVNPAVFVPYGYIQVVASVRGSGRSQGQYRFHDVEEQRDGFDLVENIAQQPWCDGKVGMAGGSYLGWSQYYTAAQRPPALKCIAPMDAGTDFYRDLIYQAGGCFYSSFLNFWGPNTISDCLFPGPIEGKLPPIDLFSEWMTHYEDGPWWHERSSYYRLDQIECPVLMVASASAWLHVRGQLQGWSRIRSAKKLVIGPQINGTMFSTIYWENQNTNRYLLRWFDHWLKGIDTGMMREPQVVIYDSGKNDWRYENEYPIARTEWTKLYLRTNPAKPAQPPQGLISLEAPAADEPPDAYNAPRPRQLGPASAAGQPSLAYITPPLERDLTLQGPLAVTLCGSSDTVNTQPLAWFVKVGDVAPDGSLRLITKGGLKASFREVDEAKSKPGQPFHPFNSSVSVDPKKIYDYQIELQPIFHTFRLGHKLWLQVCSDDMEFKLNNIVDGVVGPVAAENSVYHDAAHPSHLLLPVIPDAPIIGPVKKPLF